MTEPLLMRRDDGVEIAVTDLGGDGPPVLLLHGLAGSARELLPTARILNLSQRVVLIDQRGHGRSTRRPDDLSRAAFVGDVVAVIEQVVDGQPVTLVGQSMGAHTALLTAAWHPGLVERLVMLEGHAAGDDNPNGAAELGAYFASWPAVFSDAAHARSVLGSSPVVEAWIDDFEVTADGLRPPFDADVMQRAIEAVAETRWPEWESLPMPTLVVFAENGLFTDAQKDELLRRNPRAERADIAGASHDAHLDHFDEWVAILTDFLGRTDPNR
jgi:pimeloyl-ACP methyl ester carboxylesterase